MWGLWSPRRNTKDKKRIKANRHLKPALFEENVAVVEIEAAEAATAAASP
jgi:hypothetical protein